MQMQSGPPRRTNSMRGAATDRRTARETSVCLDSPRIHQQSHEGTGWAVLRRALLIVARTELQLFTSDGGDPSGSFARIVQLNPFHDKHGGGAATMLSDNLLLHF